MWRHGKLARAFLVVATGALMVGPARSGQDQPGAHVPKAAAAPRPQAPPAAMLYESGKVDIPAPPPLAVYAGTQCDASGNIYLQYTASIELFMGALPPRGLNLPLTKISPGSERTTVFQVPTIEGYTYQFEQGFQVSPHGDVYGLVVAYRHSLDYKDGPNWPDSFVVKYKDDGSVDSKMKLEMPKDEHLVASRLGVFGDGTLLVTGYEVSGAQHIPSGVFTSMFDRVGTYVGPVALREDVGPDPPERENAGAAKQPSPPDAGKNGDSQAGERGRVPFIQEVAAGLMVGSPDGNIYMFRATSPAKVYVISPGGSVAKQFVIHPPQSGLVPIQASFGGQGELLVEFSEPPTQGAGQANVIVLVDPGTADIVQAIAAPPSNAGVLACLSPQNEFLFLRNSKDDHLEVAKFVSR